MVPVDKFDEAISGVRQLGKVQQLNISGQDVSAQYVDLQARLKNAQAQEAAYNALLQKATTVQDIIAIQNQLGQITQLIELLEGQIAYLEHACRFKKAVRPGDTLSTEWTVTEKLDKPKHKGGICVLRGHAHNQKGELTVEADGKILVSARPSR